MQHARGEVLENYLSSHIKYIFLGNIVFEILVKKRKLLTLVIHSTGAPVYTKTKIHPGLHFPVFRTNTSHGR